MRSCAPRLGSWSAGRRRWRSWRGLLLAGERLDVGDELHQIVLADLAGEGGHDRRISRHLDMTRAKQDAVAQIALGGRRGRAVLQVDDAAVEPGERGRVHSAVGAVAAAATKGAEELLALLCQGFVHALLAEPSRVIRLALDHDVADHVRVLRPAILRTFEAEAAGLGRLEPQGLVLARQ